MDEAIDAKYIHESLAGLKWINPFFNGNPLEEIELIKEGILQIEKQDDELMLITHYLFLIGITKKYEYAKQNFHNRWDFPSKGQQILSAI